MMQAKHNDTIHILIIQRELIAGLDLQKELEKNGYEARCAVSLDNILETIVIYKPRLIIADTLPDAGYLRMLKNTWPEYDFPIIWAGPRYSNTMIEELNVVGYFQKPFDTSEALNTVKNYFETGSGK